MDRIPEQSPKIPPIKPDLDIPRLIEHYTGLERGYVPNPYELKLGPIETMYPFQEEIIGKIKKGQIRDAREILEQEKLKLKSLGVKITELDSFEEISNLRPPSKDGSTLFGFAHNDRTKVGKVTNIRIVIANLKQYLEHYSPQRGYTSEQAHLFAIAEHGHELGHGTDDLNLIPNIREMAHHLLFPGVLTILQIRESEARQYHFSARLFAAANSTGLAEQYFQLSQALAANPNYETTAKELVAKYS